MIKRSFAENVAMGMKTVLESPSYQAMFKTASEEDKKEEDKSEAKDEACADDKDAKDSDAVDADNCSADDSLDALAQYDVAINSLLTASAALDEIGTETGSKEVIKLASLIVEAKKKKVEDMKSKKDKQMAKDKEKMKKEKAKEKAEKEKAKAKGKK